MISQFGSPSVCVIDDEAADYEPMLAALLRQGIAAVHIMGKDQESTPSQPFKGIRLVLTDLHLGSSTAQKDHASHTAQVFMRTVSPEHGPVLVVIWSKFADEPVPASEFAPAPEEDQPDLADLFTKTLLEADERFKNVAIFTRMKKPRKEDRESGKWIEELENEIHQVMTRFPAISFLAEWEALVRTSCTTIAAEMIGLTSGIIARSSSEVESVDAPAQQLLRALAREQGGNMLSSETAGMHLSVVLSQILSDQLEKSLATQRFATDLSWVSADESPQIPAETKSQINASLLATGTDDGVPHFFPGTIYVVTDATAFSTSFGASLNDLYADFHKKNLKEKEQKVVNEWKAEVTPILVELSAQCDVHQGRRRKAVLVGGIAVPSTVNIDHADYRMQIPVMLNQWNCEGHHRSREFFLVFSNYFKITIPAATEPPWLQRWFRLRELPTASLRNWHTGHASRVGYLSLR